MASRLDLNFNLQTNEERVSFLNAYLPTLTFTPDKDELETISSYILWGKDPQTGLNSNQEGYIELESRHKTWDKTQKHESLDALMEQPSFNEAFLTPITQTHYKAPPLKFDREKTLRLCPPDMKDDFLRLFKEIDKLALRINLWELDHGKREKPPAGTLTAQFKEEEIEELRASTTNWTNRTYLRQRHQLVELRREQYSLKDFYTSTLPLIVPPQPYSEFYSPTLDDEIEVLPLGTLNNSTLSKKIFHPEVSPSMFKGEPELKQLSDFLQTKEKWRAADNSLWFDFRDEEHLYKALEMCGDPDTAPPSLQGLSQTLRYYIDKAKLTDSQREILEMKIKKKSNVDILKVVNKEYGKNYSENYISTIYCQKIIPKLRDAVNLHLETVQELFFPENFKACTGCGKTFLRHPENFTRKRLATDGFLSRCKVCEKLARKGQLNKK